MSEHMGDLQEQRKPVEINTRPEILAGDKQENKQIEDEIFKHDYKKDEQLLNANKAGNQGQPQEDLKAQEDAKQQRFQVIVQAVNQHLPGPLPQAVRKKLSSNQEKQRLPMELYKLVSKVSRWRKVKAETSVPVKEAAEVLRKAENDTQAALGMADLFSSCVHYLYANDGKWFKSSERKQDVASILRGITKFAYSDARSIYQERLKNLIPALKLNYKETKFLGYVEELAGDHLEADGEIETDTLEKLVQKNREKETRGEEFANATNWANLEEGAKSIIEARKEGYNKAVSQRPTTEFHHHVKDKSQDSQENRKKDAALLFKKVLKYQAPDVSNMSDFDILTDPALKQFIDVDYRTMVNDVNRLIGFGYAKDYDEIRSIKTHMIVLHMAKDIYETRLRVIAGEVGFEELLKLPGYGETREKMEEIAAATFDQRTKEDLDKFTTFYKPMHGGKKPSKAVLNARRELIEKRRSFKRYVTGGYEGLLQQLVFPRELKRIENADLRTLEAVSGFGQSTFVKRVPVTDDQGNVTGYNFEEKERTREEAEQMVRDIQSTDVVTRYGAYRAVIDDFLHKDYSILYDFSSEEKMFENYGAKRVLFAAADEMVKFLNNYVKQEYDENNLTPEQKTELGKLGFPLSKEEKAEIEAITDWCASISQVISSRYIAVKNDDTEIIGLEDAREIQDQELKEAYLSEDVQDFDYGGPGGEEAHRVLIPQISGEVFAQAGIKAGTDILALRDKMRFMYYYDGFKGLFDNDTLTSSLEARKTVKAAYSIADKAYDGPNAAAEIQKDKDKSMRLINKYAKPLNELSRKEVLEDINEFTKAGLQCDELETFCQKHGLELNEEEQKAISILKTDFDQKKLYIEKYALLVNSKAMPDLHKFGFKLDLGDSLAPGLSSKQLKEMESICASKYRKESLGHWQLLVELWPLITKVEPYLNAHVDSVINAEHMSAEELDAHQQDYDTYTDQSELFLKGRANLEEGVEITDSAVKLVTDLRLVKDDMDADTSYETCKSLSIDTSKCTREEFTKKVGAMEEILRFALLFDGDDFELSRDRSYYGKIDKRYAKVKMIGGMQELYKEYKKLTEDARFPKDGAFGGDFEVQQKVRYRMNALSTVHSRFTSNKIDMDKCFSDVEIRAKDAFNEADEQLNKAIEKKKTEEIRLAAVREAEEKKKELEALKAKEKLEKEQEKQRQEEPKEDKKQEEAEPEAAGPEQEVKAAPVKKLSKKQEAAQRRAKMKSRNKMNKKETAKKAEADKKLSEATEKARQEQEAAAQKRLEILARVTVDKTLLTVKDKQDNAKKLEDNVKKTIDDRILLRAAVPLDIKKKVNYLSFEKLSEFAFLSGGQKELERLISGYSESHKNVNKLKKLGDEAKTDLDKNVSTLDSMSASLLKLDLSLYDVSTDEKIAENAAELEKLARAMDAYQHFLDEAGANAYFNYLNSRGEEGKLILDRINKLTSISGYFRTKRLMMEDETYINYKKKRPMSTEPDEKDDFETERLKKLMKLSETYATDMNRAFDPESTVPVPPQEILSSQRRALMRLEQQRYSVSPMWLKNSLSFTKIPKKNKDDNPLFCTALNKSKVNDVIYDSVVEKHGRQELSDFYTKDFPAMLKGGVRGGSPTFVGGKDKYLEKISVSDSWNRTYLAFVNATNYRRTDEEMKEMFMTMKIQDTEEWDTIKDDPEAVAFYESAFKEMAMREISAVYANVKRVANSVGYKVLIMHPADLAMQQTTDLYVEMMGAVVATNIDQGEESLEDLKKLFENNTDGRYYFDLDDFHETGSFTASATFKATNNGRVFGMLLDKGTFDVEDIDPDADEEDVLKSIFGKKDIREIAVREHEHAMAVDPETDEVRDPIAKKFFPGAYYMYRHPELFTMKNFLKTTENGKYVLGREMESNSKSYLSTENIELIRKAQKNKRVKRPDDKEVRDYEQSLIKRNMPKLIRENDPYGIKGYFNDFEDYTVKDNQGNYVINPKTGEVKMANLMAEKHLN